MGDTVRAGRRAGLAAMLIVAASLPTLARSQDGPAETEEALVIPLHPSTPTVVQLPDEIVDAWLRHRGEFLMEVIGQNINLRPHLDTPVGTEAVVVVETTAMRRRFRLRVVERPEDAVRKIELPAGEALERFGEARQEVLPVVPAAPAPAVSAPPQPQPSHAGHASTPQRAEPAAAATGSPRFDLSVNAVVSLGFTALDIAGYGPNTAFQPHRALGVRLTGAPRDAWWALEADVGGEWATGLMVFVAGDGSRLEVRGPLLRAELGLRAQVGTKWIPTAYAGIGVQTHLRHAETKTDVRRESMKTMQDGALLALGMGLHYRARDVVLGLDFQIRRGGPDGYRSVAALWTVGYVLDQGE